MGDTVRKSRRKDLDVIRVIACFCILTVHFNASVSGYDLTGSFTYANSIIPNIYFGNVYLGEIGNSLFFFVSGASLILGATAMKKKDVGLFYLKRFKAIYPMYWIAYLIALCVHIVCFKGVSDANIGQFFLSCLGFDGYLSSFGFPANFYMLGEWFLGCILICYLIWPLFIKLWNIMAKSYLMIICSAIFLIIVFTADASIVDKLVPVRFFQMIMGAWYIWRTKNESNLKGRIIELIVFGVLTIACVLFDSFLPNILLSTVICWFLFLLIAFITKLMPNIFEILEPLNKKIAILSYPLFLVHHRLIFLVARSFDLVNLTYRNVVFLYIAYISISLLLAVLVKQIGLKFLDGVQNTNDRIKKLKSEKQIPKLEIVGFILSIFVLVGGIAWTQFSLNKINDENEGYISDEYRVYQADVISTTAPGIVNHSDQYNIDITVKNTGEVSWTEAEAIRLCIWQDNIDYGYRILIPDGVTIAPGESYTFTLVGFCMPTAENTVLEFQMLKEGVLYFGEKYKVDVIAE